MVNQLRVKDFTTCRARFIEFARGRRQADRQTHRETDRRFDFTGGSTGIDRQLGRCRDRQTSERSVWVNRYRR